MTTYSRVIVVPSDTVCTVDGVSRTQVDMSSLPVNLHAMQWYGTWGEEEYKDLETLQMLPNVRITSLDAYTAVLASFQQIIEEERRAEEEELVERTIIEV
jgi:hypothetical protein